jgi:HK97 gp10 family phage protein
MKATIKLKGLDELERNTNKMLKALGAEKQKLLMEQAQVVRDAVRQAAPRGLTGNLKGAAYAKSMPETTVYPVAGFAGIRGGKAPHGHLVEYGHGGPHPAPAYPFFFRAWESVKDRVRRAIEEGLKKTIEGSL